MESLSQELGLPVAARHAATINNTTGDTGGVDMRKFRAVIFFCSVGTNASSGSVIFKLQESSDDSTYTDLVTFPTLTIGTVSASRAYTAVRRFSTSKKYIIGKVQLRWWPLPTSRVF